MYLAFLYVPVGAVLIPVWPALRSLLLLWPALSTSWGWDWGWGWGWGWGVGQVWAGVIEEILSPGELVCPMLLAMPVPGLLWPHLMQLLGLLLL